MKLVKKADGNGGSVDWLEGKPLDKQTRVKVTFLDGSTFVGTVTCDVTTSEERCHNDRWTSTTVRAVLKIANFHGGNMKFHMDQNRNLNYERV